MQIILQVRTVNEVLKLGALQGVLEVGTNYEAVESGTLDNLLKRNTVRHQALKCLILDELMKLAVARH